MFQPPNLDLLTNNHRPKQPNSQSLPSPESLLNLLKSFMSQLSQSINSHSHTLPIFTFTQQLCPQSLCYNLQKRQQFSLTTASLNKFVRLLQICVLCIDNLKSGKYITKRNLYYKLEKYYQHYHTIDADLRLICQNLYYLSQLSELKVGKVISRADLGIVPSNRCIMYGQVQIKADGQLMSKSSSPNIDILTLPTCRVVQAKCKSKSVIIVQKQSFFYEIVNLVKQQKLSGQYLVISAKGYPDQNTRNLLLQICEQKEHQINKIYYLGDYDVYGFDIFLFYALGDWTCKGLLSKIHLLQLANYFPTKFNTQLFSILPKFSRQDSNKMKQIKNKLDALNARKQEFEESMSQKISSISKYFDKFANEGLKCELQLLNEQALKQCWIHQIIMEQNKK